MCLDVIHLTLAPGEEYSCTLHMERAFLLIKGEIHVWIDGRQYQGTRESCFDEDPIVYHLSCSSSIKIKAVSASELCIERCLNSTEFNPVIYGKGDTISSRPAKDTLDGTTDRIIRTVFDGETAPYSNMVLGEVISLPGRWSSYPPHDHPHPEIYLYRFLPEDGFGVSIIENTPYIVRQGDASLIPGGCTHSQVAAPGYAMYYIWMIPHLENKRWLQTTRNYRLEYSWLLQGAHPWHPADTAQ